MDTRSGADHDGDRGDVRGADAPPRIPSDVFVEVVRVLIVALATGAGDALGDGAGAALGACTGYVTGGVFGRWLRGATGRLEHVLDRTAAPTLVGGAIGALAAGSGGAVAGIGAVVLLPGHWGYPVLGLAAWTGIYLGFQIGASKGAELADLLRGGSSVLPDAARDVVLIDSSAAIDGRLLGLARSGFLHGQLAVPRFVLDELRGLSDSPDPIRRRRARRGLESLEALRVEGPGLLVLPDEVPERGDVDAKLVALARRLHASVLTADRGLAGVGGVEGVECLDVARLAAGLLPTLVSGETVSVRLLRAGREDGQAVGFLDDGSMVVVNDGAAHLGESIDVEIATVVPTSRGHLYFATLVE